MNDQTQFIIRLEYSILDTEYFNIFMNSDFFFQSENGNTKEKKIFYLMWLPCLWFAFIVNIIWFFHQFLYVSDLHFQVDFRKPGGACVVSKEGYISVNLGNFGDEPHLS